MEKEVNVKPPGMALIDTATLAVLVRAKAPVVLLDARSEEHDNGERIPGAKNLPPNSSAYEVDKAVGSKKTLAITYCSNLQHSASMKLFRHLKNLGYENVLQYSDGLAGWKAAGYPIQQESMRHDAVS